MNRRQMLPALLGALMFVPPVVEAEPVPRRLNVLDRPEPVNRADVPWREVIATVTVNGVEVTNAFAYDQDAGWVDRFVGGKVGQTERVFGRVAVVLE